MKMKETSRGDYKKDHVKNNLKTKVLTERIAYLIEGMDVAPENIMAVTFTRKAANEMVERIEKVVGYSYGITIGTFHSICIKILKEFGEFIGCVGFSVLNEFASRSILTDVLKANDVFDRDEKGNIVFDKDLVDLYINYISQNKCCNVGPKKRLNEAKDSKEKKDAEIYLQYNRACAMKNSLDYDDLILQAIRTVNHPMARERLKERYKYILVDEYQDINHAQYLFIRDILNGNNLFAVGDDKQCIYNFRCSDPKYLEDFTEYFEGSKFLYLDRNYRSTKNIVNASNSLISHNKSKLNVNCYSEKEDGEPIYIHSCKDNVDEAKYVIRQILNKRQLGVNYSDIAILFRNNSQSAILEDELMNNNIPYYVHNGFTFFERLEVKDILSFIKFTEDTYDQENFKRAFKCIEGIGDKVITDILNYSELFGMCCYSAMISYIDDKKLSGKSVKNIEKAKVIFESIAVYEYKSFGDLVKYIYETIGYKDKIYKNFDKKNDKEKQKMLDRESNIHELINISHNISSKKPTMTVEEYLNYTSNVQNDELDEGKVKLITIHSAKGLEYKHVFVCGVEKGFIPSALNSKTTKGEEEERRLLYVAMTRAEEELCLTYCKVRDYYGEKKPTGASKFLQEIDSEYIEYV